MTPIDVNQRLKLRLDYVQKNPGPYTGPAGDMGLEVGDILCSKGWYAIGWTKREVDSTPHLFITTAETEVDHLNYLRGYWFGTWNVGPNLALERRLKQMEQLNINNEKRKAEDTKREAAQAVVEAKYVKDYVKRWGPQPAYRDKTYDDFRAETPKQEAALEAASAFPYDASDDYETRHHSNFVLTGPVGVGKTLLAAAMFTEQWIGNAKGTEFVTATELIRKFREKVAKESVLLARYGDGKDDVTDPLDQGCEFLIIDDLGVEADAYAGQIFCEILDRRMGEDLLTVFTSNSTAAELRDWLGERGYSRLLNRCKWVVIDGDDCRLRQQQ